VPTRLPHLPVIGVVPPVKPAAARTRTGAIAILATPATIARPYVDALVHQFAPSLRVVRHGSLALVEMAEGRLRGRTPDPAAVAAEIAPLFAGPAPLPDQVCLACTHFPLLADLMAAAGPPGVSWIDSGEAIARRVAQVLGVGARPGGFHFAAMLTTGPGKALDALQPPFAWWRSPALDSLPGWGR
jgi:glutamate racemase